MEARGRPRPGAPLRPRAARSFSRFARRVLLPRSRMRQTVRFTRRTSPRPARARRSQKADLHLSASRCSVAASPTSWHRVLLIDRDAGRSIASLAADLAKAPGLSGTSPRERFQRRFSTPPPL